jgi:hypothetical protein
VYLLNGSQVLSPTWKTEAGVHFLNQLLQPLVNPPSPSSMRATAVPASPFRLHDRVMQMRNNVDKDVYNGDMGVVTSITPGKAVQVTYARPGKADEDDQDHVVTYEGLEVKQQLQLAWATTVHKVSTSRGLWHTKHEPVICACAKHPGRCHACTWFGCCLHVQHLNGMHQQVSHYCCCCHCCESDQMQAQGGEFPVVIVPLHEAMYHKLLNRTMLYTALTRAKQLVVVVATQVGGRGWKQAKQQLGVVHDRFCFRPLMRSSDRLYT